MRFPWQRKPKDVLERQLEWMTASILAIEKSDAAAADALRLEIKRRLDAPGGGMSRVLDVTELVIAELQRQQARV